MLPFAAKYLNRYNRHILLVGFVIVIVRNWQLCMRDRALARRLRADWTTKPTLSQTPRVSALVAAWNEARGIAEHIGSFLALSYPNIELILCAGGPDGTFELASRHADERVIVLDQHPGEGKQHSLARCLEHATGE